MLTHQLAGTDFDALAAGLGSPSAITALRSVQLSRRLIALRAILDLAEVIGRKDPLPGFDLLSEVQRADTAIVADVLSYPFIGSWLAQCLRLLGKADNTGAGLAAHLGYLGNIAATTAMRAGLPFSIDVPVCDGTVNLPMLGRALVDGGPMVTVESDGHDATAGGVPIAAGPRWQPVHRLTAKVGGQHLSITLDDIDPYRAPGLPAAPRLGDRAVRQWQASLSAAWGILARHHRDYAEAIGTGLAALVPLVTKRQNRGISATSRESFGAASISPAPDPLTLAIALLHEFQHGKLNAVLDVVTLYISDDMRYYAPWRQDPRPFGGLLHGAYAHVGVSDFWRVQSTLPTTPFRAYAQMEYARWSASSGEVIDVLLGSGSLTPAGERFVLGMHGRMCGWAEDIPDDIARLAGMAGADHRLGWRLRNLRPAAPAIDSLTSAWLARMPRPGDTEVQVELVDGGSSLGANDRLDLLYLWLREPGHFVRAGQRIDPADVDLIAGSAAVAARAYRARIKAEPHSHEMWAGLALALWEKGDCPDALLSRPEIVHAVYRRVLERAGTAPDPEDLARWLGPTVPADQGLDQISGRAVPSQTR
jgi:HEXXH motif-containing protein